MNPFNLALAVFITHMVVVLGAFAFYTYLAMNKEGAAITRRMRRILHVVTSPWIIVLLIAGLYLNLLFGG